jgi:2-oxoglutarate dehydrogenase E1 component
VNGDDPEAVVHATRIAIEFRQKFKKDVVLDMICYRRFGHNESDEPAFTQPQMYRVIKDHPSTLQLYSTKLVKEGTLSQAEADAMAAEFNKRLDEEFNASKSHLPNRADWLDGRWQGLEVAPKNSDRRGETSVSEDELKKVGKALVSAPPGFNLHKTIVRQLEAKAKMFETGEGFDWATCEGPGFRHLAGRRLLCPPVGPGFPARHLQPAPCRLGRSADRGTLFPAAAYR